MGTHPSAAFDLTSKVDATHPEQQAVLHGQGMQSQTTTSVTDRKPPEHRKAVLWGPVSSQRDRKHPAANKAHVTHALAALELWCVRNNARAPGLRRRRAAYANAWAFGADPDVDEMPNGNQGSLHAPCQLRHHSQEVQPGVPTHCTVPRTTRAVGSTTQHVSRCDAELWTPGESRNTHADPRVHGKHDTECSQDTHTV